MQRKKQTELGRTQKLVLQKEYVNQNKHAAIKVKQASFGNSSDNQVREEKQQIDDRVLAAEIFAQL